MAICWGPDFTFLYNDAYLPLIGTKHPWAAGPSLSRSVSRGVGFRWAIYDAVATGAESQLPGRPASRQLTASNYLEDCYFTMFA